MFVWWLIEGEAIPNGIWFEVLLNGFRIASDGPIWSGLRMFESHRVLRMGTDWDSDKDGFF